MTMAAITVRTVLADEARTEVLPFVPALMPKSGDQVVFDLVWIDKAEHAASKYGITELEANCLHDGETYIGRFGDKTCSACHCGLQWSPGWVKAGLYGSPKETLDWIIGSLNRHVIDVEGNLIGGLGIIANYDLLSDEQIDRAYGHI